MPALRAFRSSILHCLDHPARGDAAVEFLDDGIVVVEGGRVDSLGPADKLAAELGEGVELVELPGKLLVPGFIDCHVHYPQIDIVASYGSELLDWLERYAYPEERKFVDVAHARAVAGRFADALLANGTTSALVFATVHAHSASAMFEAAEARGMRLVTGKTLMDTRVPRELRDTPKNALAECRELISRWHGRGRLGYALTPRFALTSSIEQLQVVGKLAAEFPDIHLHTHLAENVDECAAVARRFPEHRSYLEVYRHYGMLRERAVFAHCVHIDDGDRQALARAKAAIAFCPSSNLYLGSGLFDLEAAEAAGIRVGIGSDVGAGPSLSLLQTLADAYRVLQLRHRPLGGMHGLYLATLGAARALGLDDRIGNFERGKEADFTLLDPLPGTAVARRSADGASIAERLFALQMLGDERCIHSTWLMGRKAWSRDEASRP